MRNRISCSAQKLSQLEPDMVQSVVGRNVYKLGNQYLAENRVRIVEADDGQISSEVDGTYGVYTQNIRLKGGTLTTKCSCPASEQPFCRHCVAVLLAFYRSQPAIVEPQPPQEVAPVEPPIVEAKPNPKPTPTPTPTPKPSPSSAPIDLKFHEVPIFIEWVQGTVMALRGKGPLPPLPDLPGEIRSWAEVIQDLHDRHDQGEQVRQQAERELNDCKQRIVTLTQDLEGVTQEAKESKVTCAALQRELQRCQEMLDKYGDVAQERDRFADQLTGVRGELLRKGAELDSLAASLKQVSAALRAATPAAR